MVRLLTLMLVATPLLMTDAVAGKKKKKDKGKDAGPTTGWVAQGDRGACYVPPDFSTLPSGPKRMAWMEARDAVMSQWQGQKGDGVAMKDKVVVNVETVLLAEADRIEAVSLENLDHCKDYMKSGDLSAWAAWLVSAQIAIPVGTPPTGTTQLFVPATKCSCSVSCPASCWPRSASRSGRKAHSSPGARGRDTG